MNNKTYDRAKFATLVLFPALGVLYAGVAAIWALPKSDEVVKTDVIVCTFLGTVLHVSGRNYWKQPPADSQPPLPNL